MKRILILFWHGLGDVIVFTPALRHLYQEEIAVDIISKTSVLLSHLMDGCPYIREILVVEDSAQAIELYKELAPGYDMHFNPGLCGDKLRAIAWAESMKINPTNYDLEVFIPPEAEEKALGYIKENYPDGHIFNHTIISAHPIHNWDSSEWIKGNLPDLPIIDTGFEQSHFMLFEDINAIFVLAREATHRVLSSSVMAHACDAMGVEVDVMNYGITSRRYQFLDMTKVKKVRVQGVWIK